MKYLLRASVALAARASCRHETPLNEKKPMRPSFLICALALLAIPASTVSSQAPSMTDSGIYFEAGGGLALFSEIGKVKSGTWYEEDGEPFYYDGTTKKDGTPTLNEADYDAGYDIGWAIGGAVGYRFGDIRAEAEVFYFSASQNRLGSADINKDVFDTPPSLSALSLMANGWYEFDTGTVFSPFIGLGLGGFQGAFGSGAPKNAPGEYEATVLSAWGFAYQAGVGVAMEVADGLSVQLGYRIFGTLETTYTTEITNESLLSLSIIPDAPDKYISALALPLMVHRIELGVSYLLPL